MLALLCAGEFCKVLSELLVRRSVQEICRTMKTVRIAAAQTVEFREDIKGALLCVAEVAAHAEAEGASLLCFLEGFLQGYLTNENSARQNALDLTSPAFEAVLNRFPKTLRSIQYQAISRRCVSS